MMNLLADCDQLVAGAAMVGGISYFHDHCFDLILENEKIIASTFESAIWAHRQRNLKKINVLSSSMVYESANSFPSVEGDELKIPPPASSYGFQKLSCEYFARSAWTQYKLPFTIIRPFNAVGIGEQRALRGKSIVSGNITLAMNHVVPDMIQKLLKGQDPLRVFGTGEQIRHFTYAGDLAVGIRKCIESEKSVNQDFNLSTETSTTIMELAKLIWQKIRPEIPFRLTSEEPFIHDVKRRIPSTLKAKELLGFQANTELTTILDEVIPWVKEQIALGTI